MWVRLYSVETELLGLVLLTHHATHVLPHFPKQKVECEKMRLIIFVEMTMYNVYNTITAVIVYDLKCAECYEILPCYARSHSQQAQKLVTTSIVFKGPTA